MIISNIKYLPIKVKVAVLSYLTLMINGMPSGIMLAQQMPNNQNCNNLTRLLKSTIKLAITPMKRFKFS